MRPQRWLFFVLLFIVLVSQSLIQASGGEETDGTVSNNKDDVVQRNPDYVDSSDAKQQQNKDKKDDDEDHSDSEIEDDDQDEEDAKTKLSKALKKSRKAPRRAIKLFKKHRTKITIALFVYAFRRELWMFFLHVFGTPHSMDPETGEVHRVIKIKPTTALKIALFVHLMRRMQTSGDGGKGIALAALLLGGRQGAFFVHILSALFSESSNPSYVPPTEQHYTFERINERYEKDGMALQKALSPPKPQFRVQKAGAGLGDAAASAIASRVGLSSSKKTPVYNETVILFDMSRQDVTVPRLKVLSDKVSFLLEQHRAKKMDPNRVTSLSTTTNATIGNVTATPDSEPELEIIITLESPGGSAADYGLAAQQILRLRDEPGIKVTVCVDRVAASGGYMMACTSSPGQLFAAPFAIVGSIGVIGQVVNVHSVLENWGVKPLVFRGGKHKSPVGILGEVTEDAITTVQSMIDKTHDAFKRHVLNARPLVAQNIDDVATGEVWLGCDALDMGLIDRVVTSDEYIGERLRGGARVLKLIACEKPHFFFKSSPRPSGPMAFVTNTVSKCLADVRTITSNLSNLFKDLATVSETSRNIDINAAARSLGVSDVSASTMS